MGNQKLNNWEKTYDNSKNFNELKSRPMPLTESAYYKHESWSGGNHYIKKDVEYNPQNRKSDYYVTIEDKSLDTKKVIKFEDEKKSNEFISKFQKENDNPKSNVWEVKYSDKNGKVLDKIKVEGNPYNNDKFSISRYAKNNDKINKLGDKEVLVDVKRVYK